MRSSTEKMEKIKWMNRCAGNCVGEREESEEDGEGKEADFRTQGPGRRGVTLVSSRNAPPCVKVSSSLRSTPGDGRLI